jgi:TPR repeat protein
MKNLVATLCLTISVLLGSVGVSSAADFNTGVNAYQRGDFATALREWTPLAQQGDARAQIMLGDMYGFGRGVAQDYVEAARLWRLAAAQGDAVAQYNLGRMYDLGQGVIQDDVEAVRLYRLSAEQGLADAQTNLGVMYDDGTGVIQDNVYAHMWANIAASTGDENAISNRDFVASRMTPAQIVEVQTLARECVAKNYIDC